MKIRDRIIGLERVPASQLLQNPRNWRKHPQAQSAALKGVLSEVGIADAVLARRQKDGGLLLLDGHLRVQTLGDQVVPVLVLDVTEAEGDKLLLTLDPLAAMAEADSAALDDLLRSVNTSNEDVAAMLDDLAKDAGLVPGEEPEVKQLEVRAPPEMAWVMIGIPVVRFGDIQAQLEQLAAIEETVVLTTANDVRDQN